MGRGKAYTPEEELAIIEYVYTKVKNDYDFGFKSTKLTREEDWIDLENKPGMERNAASLENKFRKHIKPKIYAFDRVNPEWILVIAKQLEVGMSEATQKAFQRKHSVCITLAGGMIDSWEWEGG